MIALNISKNKYSAILAYLMILLCLSAPMAAAGEDYAKDVEVGESDIKIDRSEFPYAAYLYTELKNNSDKNISNLTFKIDYYDTEGYLMKGVVLKNGLNGAIPKKSVRKYKIRLKGSAVDIEHEQYPYSQQSKVGEFDIKIMSVKLASK